MRSARKKSRDKVRQSPDDETIDSVRDEEPAASAAQAEETTLTPDTSAPLQGMPHVIYD